MKEGWEVIPFEKSIVKVKYTSKITSGDYLEQGVYPIVSQEEGLISGYWNDENDLFKIAKPVVIFGDHTRILKYVDFDFVLGADGVKILQPIDEINAKFLKYYLEACKIPSLGYSRHYKLLKEIQVPLPPLPEQEKIVAELDCLSGIIEKKKQQLKELDALAQSIFYEMFGDPVENEKGWEVKSIGDVCVLKSGDSSANNTPSGTLPYIKVGDMNMEENIPYITTSSTFVSKEENKKGIFPIGTTIFPKRGGAIFTNKKRLTTVEICCDLNTMGVIPQEEVIPLYIYHYFVSLDFAELCNGATIPQINNKDIAPLKICVPPLDYQHSFASKVEAIEKQKELIKQSIAETELLFNSRMQYYFG